MLGEQRRGTARRRHHEKPAACRRRTGESRRSRQEKNATALFGGFLASSLSIPFDRGFGFLAKRPNQIAGPTPQRVTAQRPTRPSRSNDSANTLFHHEPANHRIVTSRCGPTGRARTEHSEAHTNDGLVGPEVFLVPRVDRMPIGIDGIGSCDFTAFRPRDTGHS